jgi:hypothetical protein
VAEIQDRMTYDEFYEWLAFMSVEPIGDRRSDLHFAMLAALIANVNRDVNQRPQAYKLEDFQPDYWEERLPLSLKDKFLLIAAQINALNNPHERH